MATITATVPLAPHLRPRKPSADAATRDSNALRASVLETALELGFGSNNTVANWIFNNPLQEEEEEEEEEDEAPVNASTSQNISEDFHASSPTLYDGAEAQALLSNSSHGQSRIPTEDSTIPSFDKWTSASVAPSFMTSDPFNAAPTRGQLHTGPVQHKLRKAKRAGSGMEGYESDGWTSDSSRKTKKELKKEKSKRKKQEQEDKAQAKKNAKRERKDNTPFSTEADSGYLPESTKMSFKRSRSRAPPAKPPPIQLPSPTANNSRITSSRSLSPPSSLANSALKPSKSLSFFRLNSKSSKERSDKIEKEDSSPIPPLPNRPLPIAERFASTAPSIMSASESASVNSHGGDEGDAKSFDSGMGTSDRTTRPWISGSHPDPGDVASLSSSLSVSTATTMKPAVGYGNGSMFNGDATSPVLPGRSASPAPSANSYVVLTPTGSSQNLPGQPFVPPSSNNPLTKLMKHIPTPISLPPNPSQLHPLYSISHPNTHSISRTPSPLSSAHGFNIPTQPNSINLSPLPSRDPSPAPPSTKQNMLRPPTTTVLRRRSLVPDSHSADEGDRSDHSRVLAYYEIPAPSPPPTGPLPRPPNSQQLLVQPPIQRGRVSPFPSKPITPVSGNGMDGTGGFEGRIQVRRYRDLYALAGGDAGGSDDNGSSSGSHERHEDEDEFESTPRRRRFIANYPGVKDRPPSFYEEDSVALDNILSQYADGNVMDPSSSSEGMEEYSDEKFSPVNEMSPPRKNAPHLNVRAPIPYPRNKDPYNTFSVYSNHSIMDNEKSGEARDRFVKTVKAAYGPDGRERSSSSIDREREGMEMERLEATKKVESGRGRVGMAPPVPKLPEEFRALHKLKEERQRRRF